MQLQPLPSVIIEPIVRAALLEDLGLAGDLTTDAIDFGRAKVALDLVARRPGIVAGLDFVTIACRLIDPAIAMSVRVPDDNAVQAGAIIATMTGPARGILTVERVALNFLCHLSGIATATAELVEAVRGTRARITCTRKTLPGLRAAQKYAVRAGGGVNHRFGLADAVLIKDNHIALAGGISRAVAQVRERTGHLVKIEVEIDSLDQLDEALGARVDAILLDNMSPGALQEAVHRVNGRLVTEASGGVSLATAAAIAESGVDFISAGYLTHSPAALDIGLDISNLTAITVHDTGQSD